MKIRGTLYTTAKYLGDFQAITKGPAAMLRRIMRRVVGRFFAGLIGKI